MNESLKVLYVEDARESYIAVEAYMRELGHQMLPRQTQLATVKDEIKLSNPDVLILDLDLRQPELSDAGARMRETATFATEIRESYPHMVILVHSHLDKVRTDVVRMLVAAGISYLVKEGVDEAAVLERVIAHARSGGAAYDAHVVRHFPEVIALKSSGALTPRQWDVAALCRDKTDAEIGAYLNISEKRVSELLAEARNRLGLRSKTDLALWYAEQEASGNAPPPPERKIK